jgi:hypothetical protein
MITTFSSREFHQNASGAKKAALKGPVFITDRGRPAQHRGPAGHADDGPRLMWLLDTHVVSELRKARTGRADPNGVAWAQSVAPASSLFLSVITLQALELGVLRTWLDEQVIPAFADRGGLAQSLVGDLSSGVGQSVGAAPNTRPECSRIAWNWMSGTRSCATRRSELYCTRKAGAPTTS